jgi:endonuclease/exonuclease/phosphatase family metal-dependent hydrolase
MLRLVSLNMEGAKHQDVITSFLDYHQPDVICLQEMPSHYIHTIMTLGYHVTFRPLWTDCELAPDDAVGVAIASKTTHDAETFWYYGQKQALRPFDSKNKITTSSFGCIISTVTSASGETYNIATTHLPVTSDGKSDNDQCIAVDNLLKVLKIKKPHILCGDMNMPRGYNDNYQKFTDIYTDEVPTHYRSSLDRVHHRCANKTDLNAPIFDIYMVDYIFTQPPYTATNVRLEFGVSDHAAVLADIFKE